MNKTSTYEKIKTNIGENGKLPHTFTLEEKPAPNQIAFMPGAMDGIGVFHMGCGNEKKDVKKILSLLKKYFKTGNEQYILKFEMILKNTRVISLIDTILQALRNDYKGLDSNRIVELSLSLIQTSENIEMIKIMIGILGLFDLGAHKNIVETVTTLALYDEFTLYAVVAASNWTGGNDAIFRIAKGVDCWGKIHAVEGLEPQNDEIRDWILRDGCSNGIMDAYLGLTCAVKGDLISALRQDSMNEELFDSIAIIVGALLNEGPVDGISSYEHRKEAMTLFMNHAKKHVVSVEHLLHILNVKLWAESGEIEYKEEVLAACSEIINQSDWQRKIIDIIKLHNDDFKYFCACNAASRLDIDVSSEFFAAIKANPLKHYSHIPQLFKKPEFAETLIRTYETALPLDDMAEGMGDYLFSDNLNQEHQCLDFILPELAAYPMQGMKLIKTGLNSRIVRERNMACRALSGWMKILGKPLDTISPELYEELGRIYKIEVNKETKKTMRKIINGEVAET